VSGTSSASRRDRASHHSSPPWRADAARASRRPAAWPSARPAGRPGSRRRRPPARRGPRPGISRPRSDGDKDDLREGG
jgi:hypothetical protein